MRIATVRGERATLATRAGGVALATVLGVVMGVLLSRRGAVTAKTGLIAASTPRLAQPRPREPAALGAGRRLNRAAGTLALSVLIDSATEHYRGSFHNKAMLAPLISSTLSLLGSMHGTTDRRPLAHRPRDAVYALAFITGLAGTAFHIYNVGKRPGGFSWLNLFYAAPIGAPAALSLSGMLGFLAERLRQSDSGVTAVILGWPAGRFIAVLTGASLIGTVGEAGLLHFRGAYHNPAMFLPVGVPPVAAMLLIGAALRGQTSWNRITRWWLRLGALLGIAGVGFHAFGVSRNMGGWRNWSQNILNGPPLPAPPSFTGLSLAGLAALDVMEAHADA